MKTVLKTYDVEVEEPATITGWRQIISLEALKTAMTWSMIEAPAMPEGGPLLQYSGIKHPHSDDFPVKAVDPIVKRSGWSSGGGNDFAWLTGDANDYFKNLMTRVVEIVSDARKDCKDMREYFNRTQVFHCHVLWQKIPHKIHILWHVFEFPKIARVKLFGEFEDVPTTGAEQYRLLDEANIYHKVYNAGDKEINYHNFLFEIGGTKIERCGPGSMGYGLYSDDLDLPEFGCANWFPNDPAAKRSLHADHCLFKWTKPNKCEYANTKKYLESLK